MKSGELKGSNFNSPLTIDCVLIFGQNIAKRTMRSIFLSHLMNTHPARNLVVRIHPSKFWSATRLMTNQERDSLLEAIEKLAEAGDLAGLEHFDFVSIAKRPDPVAA